MVNPSNEFRGTLVSVNPTDKSDFNDVRDIFVAHVEVDGKRIPAYTDHSKRVIDITPHVELVPVADDGGEPMFSDWECIPSHTPGGQVSDENPYPNKPIVLRLRDDGQWVVSVVVQDAYPELGIEQVLKDISCPKGSTSSIKLNWENSEIDYGDIESIVAMRECLNLYGYRLGEEGGLNEGKLLQSANGGSPGPVAVKLMVNTTWSSLKNLRDQGRLQPGTQYRIMDYVATTNGESEFQSANHPFDIVVVADDKNTLNEVARAIASDQDPYFRQSRLESWQVWYCIDNDESKFAWATPDGKGVVYRLIDEFGNDAPYDFKGIQFKAYGDEDDVWRYTFDSGVAEGNTDLSLQGSANGIYGNTIKPYHLGNGQRKLNRMVFKGKTCHSNSFGNNCRENTFGAVLSDTEQGLCCYNMLGVENFRNTFGYRCSSNQFGDYCSNNSFGNNCNSNKFGDTCSINKFGNACKQNISGIECQMIVFGDMCSNNKFGNACKEIYSGDRTEFCRFGNSVFKVYFGDSSNPQSGYRFIRIGDCVRIVELKCTAQRPNPSSRVFQLVSVEDGVSNKTIENANFNQTHQTKYQLAGEETISI